MKIIYEADDGKQFYDKYNCELYENKSKDKKKAKEALTIIQEICSEQDFCEKCPFCRSDGGCVFQTFNYDTPVNFLNYFEGQ